MRKWLTADRIAGASVDDCDADADAADVVRCTRNAVDAAGVGGTMDPTRCQASLPPPPPAIRPQIVRVSPPRNRCVAASPSPHLQRERERYI